MPLLLLLGGARSGKSTLAVSLASSQPQPVVFIATAEALDSDMASRIARHRDERPTTWTTLEEPRALATALADTPAEACVIVDCLTLWVSNLLHGGLATTEVDQLGRETAVVAAERDGWTIAVTNEVGLGIVPANDLARSYRDLLGRINASWAAAADRALLVAAGRTLPLGVAPTSLADLG